MLTTSGVLSICMHAQNYTYVYRYYINYTRIVFTVIIPVLALSILNAKIFRGIRLCATLLPDKSTVFFSRFSHLRSKSSVCTEINLSFILICIVCVFIFCNIPRVFLNCYEFYLSDLFIRSVIRKLAEVFWYLNIVMGGPSYSHRVCTFCFCIYLLGHRFLRHDFFPQVFP